MKLGLYAENQAVMQAQTSLPQQPPGSCTYFQPGSRGFVPSELPEGRTYYQSTKLLVDAA